MDIDIDIEMDMDIDMDMDMDIDIDLDMDMDMDMDIEETKTDMITNLRQILKHDYVSNLQWRLSSLKLRHFLKFLLSRVHATLQSACPSDCQRWISTMLLNVDFRLSI